MYMYMYVYRQCWWGQFVEGIGSSAGIQSRKMVLTVIAHHSPEDVHVHVHTCSFKGKGITSIREQGVFFLRNVLPALSIHALAAEYLDSTCGSWSNLMGNERDSARSPFSMS